MIRRIATRHLQLSFGLLLSLLALPVQAGWRDTWNDVKGFVSEEAEKATDKLSEFLDELSPNEYLQKLYGSGVDEHSALVGTFYDLKKPLPGSNLRPASPSDTVAIIQRFVKKGWDAQVLEKYYSPQVRLYAPYFYLPRCKASYAPVAFQCQDKDVKPSCWVAIYRGIVKAPKTARYRFVGMGDDVLMVRFNNKTVLEHGWSIPTRGDMTLGTKREYWKEITTARKNPCALFRFEEIPHWNRNVGGMASGKVFDVKEGKEYPIEILISEIPGNEFGYALLIEELGKKQLSGFVDGNLCMALQLFRTNATNPSEEKLREALRYDGEDYMVGNTMECPPFDPDSPVWEVNYDKSKAAGFLDHLLQMGQSDQGRDTAMGKQKFVDEEEDK